MRELTHASCKEQDLPRQRIISIVVIGGSDHSKVSADALNQGSDYKSQNGISSSSGGK